MPKASPPSARPFLTVLEIAESFGVSSDKVVAFIRSGELSAFNVANSASKRPRFRIKREDFAAFIERRAITPPPPRTRRRRADRSIKQFV